MRILCTGASGFVGSHIRTEIETPDNEILYVTPVGERPLPVTNSSRSIEADLRDIGDVKGAIQSFSPEACIHCAWQGIPDYGEEISKLNLDNSIKLVDMLFKETECKKLIVSGSCLEYGKTHGKCEESETGDPSLFIAWAKQALYHYAALLAKRNDRSLVWFRMFYVYGWGQRKESLIPTLVDAFRNSETPKLNKPNNGNDYVWMGDAAQAYRIAIDRDIPSGIYNLGRGKTVKAIDICRTVEKCICGKETVSDIIARDGEKTVETDFYADTKKTKQQLGWEAKTGMREGIEKYIQSLEGRP